MTARDAHGVDLSVEETARGDFLDDYQSHVTGLLNGASGSTRQRVCGVDRVHPASPEALAPSSYDDQRTFRPRPVTSRFYQMTSITEKA